MSERLYEHFIALKNRDDKVEAKVALRAFIDSFESPELARGWVFSFLEKGDWGHRIRHELYERLVYPVLLDGYLKHDAKSAAWLARTAGNLHAIKLLHPSLKNKAEYSLLKEAYDLDSDEKIRAELLESRVNWFHFSQHEWPAGILYGMDGADIEQCGEILHEIEFARSLDRQGEYDAYLSEFETRVHEYMGRLREGT